MSLLIDFLDAADPGISISGDQNLFNNIGFSTGLIIVIAVLFVLGIVLSIILTSAFKKKK